VRVILSSVLILVLLIQTFSRSIIYVSFKINQDYISANLCENRNAPEKHCCGKCQLEKRLKQDEQNQNSQLPSSLKDFNMIQLFNEESQNYNLFYFLTCEILFQTEDENLILIHPDEIFHPPSLV
jgi:hypothetical protein